MSKGKLIVIEGSDGCGKATQAMILYESLVKEGKRVRLISFPNYSSPTAEPVKMYLSGKFGEKAEDTNLFAVSTFFAIDRFGSYMLDWKDFYESGGIIIADRYATSNMIHQGSRASQKGMSLESYVDWVRTQEYVRYGIPAPDCVIFLDVPPEVSIDLMKDRKNKFTQEAAKDIHERDQSFLEKSYATATQVVKLDGWKPVSCTENQTMRSRESIAEEILQLVQKAL